MRIVFALILLVGLGLAGSAAYMVMQRFNEYEAALAAERRNQVPQIETTEVAVAARKLEFARYLKPEDVRMVKWPADAVPPGAFLSLEDVVGAEGQDPRAILRDILPNEPILPGMVTNFGEDAGIRSRLAPGMRAITIRVDVTTGVAGFLQPGDRVDIFWTGDAGGKTITKLIFEKIKLIAIDQTAQGDGMTPSVARNVTVEVSPQIVAELTQAQRTGQLTLSLRGVEDVAETGVIEVDQTDITGVQNIVEEEKPVCTIRTRKGAEVIELVVPCPVE